MSVFDPRWTSTLVENRTPDPRKIVVVSTQGYRRELDALVAGWIKEGVTYVGVVGVDSSNLEDVIDDLCIGVGTDPYFMFTASHGDDETVDDAVELAK